MALEQAHSTHNGVSWGARPRILVRHLNCRDVELIWIPGGTGYVDRVVGNKYSPSSLRIIDKNKRFGFTGKVLHEGGKISKALLMQFAAEIDEVFGRGVAARLSARDTVYL